MADVNLKRPRVPRGGRRTKNATYSLPSDLLQEVEAAVVAGAAPSKNAFVEGALRRELAQIRRQTRRARLEAAKNDPLFLRDIAEIEQEFAFADAESARGII